MKIAGQALCAIAAVYAGQALALNISCGQIMPSEMYANSGYAFFVSKNFGFPGDTRDSPSLSKLKLFENGVELGPAHTLHSTIRGGGGGAFSHWYNGMYFSSSDNSNPRTNGRTYTFSGPCSTPRQLNLVEIGTSTTGYATFQSHNQKIVQNQYGIFLIYLESIERERGRWKFLRSTDNGVSFQTLHVGADAIKPPTMETDEAGNVYLIDSKYQSCGRVFPSDIVAVEGNAYLAQKAFGQAGDTLEFPQQSNLILYEDGLELGPIHTQHAQIRTLGSGAFSHWYNTLYFSSSDNTDPRVNGRTYTFSGTCAEENGPHAVFYKFSAMDNYRRPIVRYLPNGSAGKYTSYYDAYRKRIYYFTFWDAPTPNFFILDLDGNILQSLSLTQPGGNARIQYPHLAMGGTTLYAAWTTYPHSGPFRYWDIHFMLSEDGGYTWKRADGTPLALPVVADNTGPTDMVNLPDELDISTWLSSFTFLNNSLHFFYFAYEVPFPFTPSEMSHEMGNAYYLARSFRTSGDTSGNSTQSQLRLFENNIELGPAHTLHDTIRQQGRGAFSHWYDSLYFSSSDNSNPIINGRSYTFLTSFEPRQHYVRYNLKTKSRDIDTYPLWRGITASIGSLDGYFVTKRDSNTAVLYAVAKTRDNRIAVLKSDDSGATWIEHALSNPVYERAIYSIGGFRYLTNDNHIIGTVTLQDMVGSNHRVIFFRVSTNP